MSESRRVVVIGGGIAGLAAAYLLQKQARNGGFQIVLLEAQTHLGGKIQTERSDGFILEQGPDAFLARKPWAIELCRDLGIEDRLQGTIFPQGRVYILRAGRLNLAPDGLTMMVPSRLGPLLSSPLLSRRGRLRAAIEAILPAKNGVGDESIGTFISRRFGRELYEHLVEPLMSGIYAGDGDRLSLRATFPILREWEVGCGSVMRGAHGLATEAAKAGALPTFLTPIGGMGELVVALVNRLKRVDVRVGTTVTGVERVGSQYLIHSDRDQSFTADSVIVAAPAFAAAALLARLHTGLSQLLAQIEHTSTAIVSLAYRSSDLQSSLNGHGYVIPRVEGRRALACTWTSLKFANRAPPGHILLRVFLGRAGQEPEVWLDDDALMDIARREVADTLDLRAEPRLVRISRWLQGLPQYNLGHLERLDEIENHLISLPGLYLAGAAYHGVGIPDCIRSGQHAAERALSHLREPSRKMKAPPRRR